MEYFISHVYEAATNNTIHQENEKKKHDEKKKMTNIEKKDTKIA